MARRILDVNADTTLEYAEGRVDRPGGTEEGVAVVNATAPGDDPDYVELGVEMDATDVETVPHHADRVVLSPDQARELAADLVDAADSVTDADEGDSASDAGDSDTTTDAGDSDTTTDTGG
jgi:hypothetical protein